MTEMDTEVLSGDNSTCFACADADENLINAYIRLAELLGQPESKQKIFAPMIMKEIHYLLLTGEYNAETASYLVGYESPTQFSREYKKMFGNPPKTDVKHLFTV